LGGNVITTTDIATETAVNGIVGGAVVSNPAIGTVMVTQTIFHGKRLPGLKCLPVGLETIGQIVGMDPFCPAIPQLLRQGPSGKLQPGLVKIVTTAIKARMPDQGGKLLDNLSPPNGFPGVIQQGTKRFAMRSHSHGPVMKGKDTLRVGAPYRLSQNKTTTINTRRPEQKQFIKNRH
jgi:hypothetical protein